MNSTNIPDGITPDSATSLIDNTANTMLTAADSTSADRIQSLSLIQQARASRLTRNAASMITQFGANSAQALAAQQAVASIQNVAARVSLVHQQFATVAPQVAATGWAIHGRVYDAKMQPVSGQTVFLVDAQKNYLSEYGFSYTDSTGYFLINYSGPAGQAAAQSDASSEIFIQVANASAKPVYLSSTAFQPSLGNAIYQTITLSAGEAAIGDPPTAVRKVAIPPKKSKA